MKKIITGAFLLLVLVACKKDRGVREQPPAPTPVFDDARIVLLKEIEAPTLPSPYFHFEYDALQYVKKISFASNFYTYDVEYQNNRVKKMTNRPNHDALIYTYANSNVSNINEYSGINGQIILSYHFAYNSGRQLTEVILYQYTVSGAPQLLKKRVLAYGQDGNLSSIDLFYALTPGQLTWLNRIEYSNYDGKTNVGDFMLIRDFFDAVLFLPQVRLQKNNPLREHVFGATNEIDIINSYQYQGNLPVSKSSVITETRNGVTGIPGHTENHYSYY